MHPLYSFSAWPAATGSPFPGYQGAGESRVSAPVPSSHNNSAAVALQGHYALPMASGNDAALAGYRFPSADPHLPSTQLMALPRSDRGPESAADALRFLCSLHQEGRTDLALVSGHSQQSLTGLLAQLQDGQPQQFSASGMQGVAWVEQHDGENCLVFDLQNVHGLSATHMVRLHQIDLADTPTAVLQQLTQLDQAVRDHQAQALAQALPDGSAERTGLAPAHRVQPPGGLALACADGATEAGAALLLLDACQRHRQMLATVTGQTAATLEQAQRLADQAVDRVSYEQRRQYLQSQGQEWQGPSFAGGSYSMVSAGLELLRQQAVQALSPWLADASSTTPDTTRAPLTVTGRGGASGAASNVALSVSRPEAGAASQGGSPELPPPRLPPREPTRGDRPSTRASLTSSPLGLRRVLAEPSAKPITVARDPATSVIADPCTPAPAAAEPAQGTAAPAAPVRAQRPGQVQEGSLHRNPATDVLPARKKHPAPPPPRSTPAATERSVKEGGTKPSSAADVPKRKTYPAPLPPAAPAAKPVKPDDSTPQSAPKAGKAHTPRTANSATGANTANTARTKSHTVVPGSATPKLPGREKPVLPPDPAGIPTVLKLSDLGGEPTTAMQRKAHEAARTEQLLNDLADALLTEDSPAIGSFGQPLTPVEERTFNALYAKLADGEQGLDTEPVDSLDHSLPVPPPYAELYEAVRQTPGMARMAHALRGFKTRLADQAGQAGQVGQAGQDEQMLELRAATKRVVAMLAEPPATAADRLKRFWTGDAARKEKQVQVQNEVLTELWVTLNEIQDQFQPSDPALAGDDYARELRVHVDGVLAQALHESLTAASATDRARALKRMGNVQDPIWRSLQASTSVASPAQLATGLDSISNILRKSGEVQQTLLRVVQRVVRAGGSLPV